MSNNTNFATWNELTMGSRASLADGNLTMKGTTVDLCGVTSTMGITSGKWYWEVYVTDSGSGYFYLGLTSGYEGGGFYSGYSQLNGMVPGAIRIRNNGTLSDSSSSDDPDRWGTITLTSTNVNSFTDGDILGFALDYDNKKLWFGKNGTFMNSGNPASGSNEQASWSGDIPIIYPAAEPYYTNNNMTANFGQDSSFAGNKTSGSANATDGNGYGDFYYTPPTGYLALCSANLPTSDDIDPAQTDDNYPGKQFGVAAYSGNSGTQSIDLGFKPDLIWTKIRVASDSRIVDSTRGTDSYLISNTSAAESTVSTGVTAFTTTGYNLGSDGIYNGSSYNYVSWCWRANGGTTSSNSDGDITSTVQANQEAGFSIMKWTGNGSSNQTIGHGLGAVPDIWMVKNIDSSGDWRVGLNTTAGAAFNSLSGSNDALKLNGTDAAAQMWRPEGNFTATSTTCNTPNNGNSAAFFTTSGDDFIGYCWRGIEGFSKFGIYEGNNNADGPFIYLGFRPRLVVIKNIDSAQDWIVMDTARETRNPLGEKVLAWNDDYAEFDPSTVNLDVTSNGFKIRGNDTKINSSATFIYMCWGDVPFKYNNTF